MNAISWSGVVLVLTAWAAAAQEPPAQSAAVTREYDVRALQTSSRTDDDSMPALGFVEVPSAPGDGARAIASDTEEHFRVTMDDGLQTLIHDSIAKGTWEGEHTLKTLNGILYVRHTPEVQATVALLIEALRARLERPVALELREVRGPCDAAEAVLAGGPVLDAARAALLAGEGFTAVRSARLVGSSGEPLHRGSTRDSSYVRGYDVLREAGAPLHQPVTGWLRTGELDGWRAALDDDGRGLLVEYQRDAVAAAQPHPTGIVGRARSDGEPPRTIELPRLAERRTASALWMPSGGQAIVESWRDGDAVHFVVLMHVARAEPPAVVRIPSGSGTQRVTLFDARSYALGRAEVEPSPALEPDGPAARSGVDEAVEDGRSLAALIDLVKETVHPTTWEDERCTISSLRGVLLVANEPAVLDDVEAMLRRLERARSVSILVRSQLLEAGDEPAAHALTEVVGDLNADQRAAVRARVATGKVVVRADRAITAMTGHRALQLIGERRAFVGGYAARDGALTPTVGRVGSGVCLLVCPTVPLAAEGAAVDVELRDLALEMGEERELDDGERLQRPELRQHHRQARLAIADGGATLVDLGDGRFLKVEVRISRAP